MSLYAELLAKIEGHHTALEKQECFENTRTKVTEAPFVTFVTGVSKDN